MSFNEAPEEYPDDMPMTRQEWVRRYADRIKEMHKWHEDDAMAVAEAAAVENFQMNGDMWLDPEEDADVEMSYWDDDEDAE